MGRIRVTGQPYPQTLAELIEFNQDHPELEGPWNDLVFELAEATNGRDAECADIRAGVTPPVQDAIDGLMAEKDLDAIIALTNGPAWPTNDDPAEGDLEGRFGEFFVGSSGAAAVSGYADITVPAGYIEGLPIGITFIGGRWAEPELLGLAYDYEQATQVRVPPQFIPTIGDDSVPRRPELAGSGADAAAAGDPRSARSRRAFPVAASSTETTVSSGPSPPRPGCRFSVRAGRVRRRGDRFASCTRAELPKDRRDVVVDGSPRDDEAVGDLGVAKAFRDERENLELARRECGRVLARGCAWTARDRCSRARSAWRTACAAGRAPSSRTSSSASRRSSSSSLSARARADSYMQPCGAHAAAAPRASPPICLAYGSAIQSGARVELAALPLPVRELAREPEMPLLERKVVDGARFLERA